MAQSSISQTATKKKRVSQIGKTKSSQSNDLFNFKMPDAFYKDVKTTVVPQKQPTLASMNPRLKKEDESDEDEDYETSLLSERKLDKRERESYKNKFLTKFLEKYEDTEQQ